MSETISIAKRMNLWDDGVKYTICWALFLISTKEKSILFGMLSIITLIYFIIYESKNIIKYLPKYKREQKYIYLRSIISILFLVVNINLTGSGGFVIISFINVYSMLVSIVGPLIWNENIYFDDKANNLDTLFATKNGKYSRTRYVADKLGLKLPLSNKYVSVTEDLSYLDKLANKVTNLGTNELEELKLILSVDGDDSGKNENKLKKGLLNCIYFIVVLFINGKVSIQFGAVGGVDISSIDIENMVPVIIALFLSLVIFLPLIIKTYKSAKIAKNSRRLLLIIIERAIQIIKQQSNNRLVP